MQTGFDSRALVLYGRAVPRPNYQDYKARVLDRYLEVLFSKQHSLQHIEHEYQRYWQFFEKNYARHLPKKRDAKILELGCGLGHLLYCFKKAGYQQVFGVDLSRQLVDFCKSQGHTVEQANILNFIENTTQRYDVIILEGVINYLEKAEVLFLMERIVATLEDKGVCIVKAPNVSTPVLGPNTRYRDFVSEQGFTEESLRQVCVFGGFEKVEVLPLDIFCMVPWPVRYAGRILQWAATLATTVWYALYGRTGTRIFTKDILAVCVK